jgi:serine/threonine-protein kinase
MPITTPTTTSPPPTPTRIHGSSSLLPALEPPLGRAPIVPLARTIPPAVRSSAVQRILARALERDLSRRYKTAGQLADALEEQLASIGGVHGAMQVAAWMGEVLAEKKAAREKLLRALGDDPHARAEPLLRDDGWLEPSDAKEMALGTAVRRPGRAWAAAATLLLGLVLSVTLGWTLAPGSEPVATSRSAPRAEGTPAEDTPPATAAAADPRATADPAAGEEAPPATTEGTATAVEIAATSGETETGAVAGAAVLEPPTADPETPRAERSERSRRGSRSGTASGTDEPRAPRGTASSGRLNLMAIPPAEVFLGGRSLGRTPLVNVTLPAGRHQLTLRPIGGGTARTTTVTIRPGERTLESVRL